MRRQLAPHDALSLPTLLPWHHRLARGRRRDVLRDLLLHVLRGAAVVEDAAVVAQHVHASKHESPVVHVVHGRVVSAASVAVHCSKPGIQHLLLLLLLLLLIVLLLLLLLRGRVRERVDIQAREAAAALKPETEPEPCKCAKSERRVSEEWATPTHPHTIHHTP